MWVQTCPHVSDLSDLSTRVWAPEASRPRPWGVTIFRNSRHYRILVRKTVFKINLYTPSNYSRSGLQLQEYSCYMTWDTWESRCNFCLRQKKLQASEAEMAKGQAVLSVTQHKWVLIVTLTPETIRTVNPSAWLTTTCHSVTEDCLLVKRWWTKPYLFMSHQVIQYAKPTMITSNLSSLCHSLYNLKNFSIFVPLLFFRLPGQKAKHHIWTRSP